jgi:hypothetical protein
MRPSARRVTLTFTSRRAEPSDHRRHVHQAARVLVVGRRFQLGEQFGIVFVEDPATSTSAPSGKSVGSSSTSRPFFTTAFNAPIATNSTTAGPAGPSITQF